jgi:hypothetical protein
MMVGGTTKLTPYVAANPKSQGATDSPTVLVGDISTDHRTIRQSSREDKIRIKNIEDKNRDTNHSNKIRFLINQIDQSIIRLFEGTLKRWITQANQAINRLIEAFI